MRKAGRHTVSSSPPPIFVIVIILVSVPALVRFHVLLAIDFSPIFLFFAFLSPSFSDE